MTESNNSSALATTQENVLATVDTNSFKEAPSLMDINFESLIADVENIESMREQGLVEEDFEYYIGQPGEDNSHKYDTSWADHRQCKFKDETAISWSRVVPKKVKEAGITSYPVEISPKYRVVGLRGIPFKFEFGFGFGGMIETLVTDKTGVTKPSKIFPCKTRALLNLDNNTQVTASRPLNRPVYQLHKDKKNITTLNSYFPWDHKALIADKFDFEAKRYSDKPKSCQECISEGAWFLTQYKDENDTPQLRWGGDITNVIQGGKCSLNGSLLFFVTQIGIDVLDSPHYEEDEVTYPREVKWVLPEDLKMKDRDKGFQSGPFIIRLEGLGKSLIAKIGDGGYDLNVKLPSMYADTEQKTYYLPDDNVLTAYELNQFLFDKQSPERRVITQGSGKTLFPVYTEMYLAPLKETQASKSVTPVFRVIDVGINSVVEGVPMKDYLKAAVATYCKEVTEAKGEETDISVPQFPVVTSGVLPSYNTGSQTLTKKAFTAPAKAQESLASKAFGKAASTAKAATTVSSSYSKPTAQDMLIDDEEDDDEA